MPEVTPELLRKQQAAKERLVGEILVAGEPVRSQAELLFTIMGITPLVALAPVAHVAEVERSKTLRKTNAYLTLVSRGFSGRPSAG